MTIHLLTDSDFLLLREIVQKYRQGILDRPGRQPALPNDLQDSIFTPEVYFARTPPDGIPALVQSSSLGTGAEPTDDPDRPGSAYCYIYRILEDDFGVERLYPIDQYPKQVYNLLNVAIPGRAWVTILREKFGKYHIPAQGFNFRQCTEETIGTGTGTGTSGSSQGGCDSGDCGDEGVALTLTATVTNKVGCYTTLPDTINFVCTNVSGGHWWTQSGTMDDCGDTASWLIAPISVSGGLRPSLSGSSFNTTPCEDGWTCFPFSAVFLIDNMLGATATITVVS